MMSYVDLNKIKTTNNKNEYAINFSANFSVKLLLMDNPNKAIVEAKISIKLSIPKLSSEVEFSSIPKYKANTPSSRL